MSDDDFGLVCGSNNVFRDFGYPDADIRQTKAILVAAILKTLDARGWKTRKAEELTGINHVDFSHIRRVNIGRFSMERLAAILTALGQDVEFLCRCGPARCSLP